MPILALHKTEGTMTKEDYIKYADDNGYDNRQDDCPHDDASFEFDFYKTCDSFSNAGYNIVFREECDDCGAIRYDEFDGDEVATCVERNSLRRINDNEWLDYNFALIP